MNAIDRGTVEAVIKIDRQAGLRVCGGMFSAISGGIALLLFRYFAYPDHPKYLLWLTGSVAIFIPYILIRLFRPWGDGVAYTITSHGIIDGFSGWGWIGWDEIISAELRSTYLGVQTIELLIRHPDAVIARLPASRRWYMSTPPVLNVTVAEGGGERLLWHIRQRLHPKAAASDARPSAAIAQAPVRSPGAHAWHCYKCGAANEPNVQQCKACGFTAPHPAPPPLVPADPWVCPKCGLFNETVTAVCLRCGCPAYSPQTGPPDLAVRDHPPQDSSSALLWSIAGAAAGIVFAMVAFQKGHVLMAITFLAAGCGAVPWLEYKLLRDNRAPYARSIFYLFLVLAALIANRAGA